MDNLFKTLYEIDVSNKVKQKNGLSYLSWAATWAEVKKIDPDAKFHVYEDVMSFSPSGDPWKKRPWFDDGKTAWVKVGVMMCGKSYTEILPIMDFKNKPIAADLVTSMDANKAIKRCLSKACSLHGVALYLYEGEDLPEEAKEAKTLQTQVNELATKKWKNEKLQTKITELINAADESGEGKIQNITNHEVLKKLKADLTKLR